MTDSPLSIPIKCDTDVSEMKQYVEPIPKIKQEIHDCDGSEHHKFYHIDPESSILGKIYEKLQASEERSRLLEQKISDIESTVKERASKEQSFLELTQEAVQCHYLGEASKIVESQKEAMDQWEKKNDDRMENLSEENKAALKEIQNHMNMFAEFLSNNSAESMQQITGMINSNNLQFQNITKVDLAKFTEENYSALRKVRSQVNQFGEAIARINPESIELKSFKDQMDQMQTKLDDIQKQIENAAKHFGSNEEDDVFAQLQKHNDSSGVNKLKDTLNQIWGYCKNRAAENTKEAQKTSSALEKMNDQMKKISERLDKQKDTGRALEKVQDELRNMRKSLRGEGKCDDDEGAEKKDACLFCRYTDHQSVNCHLFLNSHERLGRLIVYNICELCLGPKAHPFPCPLANMVCHRCQSKDPEFRFTFNHNPIVCINEHMPEVRRCDKEIKKEPEVKRSDSKKEVKKEPELRRRHSEEDRREHREDYRREDRGSRRHRPY